MRESRSEPNLLKGLAAGVAAGLVASAVMNQFQKLAGRLIRTDQKGHGAQSQQRGTPDRGIGEYLADRGLTSPNETAPERLAAATADAASIELSERQKETAGVWLHYAYGTSMAAIYGAAAEALPEVTTGAGLPFGALIWLGADEGIVPVLGLSKTPFDYSLSTHAYALASHLVYGATTEGIRRVTRAML